MPAVDLVVAFEVPRVLLPPPSLIVQAFHTFPDDYAIVKSQSLFQLP